MQGAIILFAAVTLLASGVATKKIKCFTGKVGEETFEELMARCIKITDQTEASLDTNMCLWKAVGITKKGDMPTKLESVMTPAFKALSGPIILACDLNGLRNIAECMDEKLSPICDDDEEF